MSFEFKKFKVDDSRCAMKIGTDGVLLGAWTDVDNVKRVLDIGAGSGLISLMIAQRNREARVCAVEIDEGASADARANVSASPWKDRISIIEGDFASFTPDTAPDLIVSNPPFFSETLKSPSAERSLARHAAGLGPQSLIEYAARTLSADGTLAFITPTRAESEILFTAEMARLRLRRLTSVKTSPRKNTSRLLWQFSRVDGPTERRELTIAENDGKPTEEYRALTRDFYLEF